MTEGLISYPADDPVLSERFGLRVFGAPQGNRVMVHEAAARLAQPFDVFFQTGSDNVLRLEEGCRATGRAVFNGSGAQASIGGHAHANLDVWMYGGGRFSWGNRSVCYGMRAWVHGEKSMVIGDDCLFSEGIHLRTSDHHSVIDLDSLSQINFPADLHIGRHVWIGPDVLVMKGVTIGDGSIVGARSVVTRPIGAAELWIGSPARRVRRNVSWVDTHPAIPIQVSQLAEMGIVSGGSAAIVGPPPSQQRLWRRLFG